MRLPAAVLVSVVLLFAGACTESDSELVSQVGTTRLLLVDTGQALQSLSNPEEPYQVTRWNVRAALLELNGDSYDLLFGGSCTFTDTIAISPTAVGSCAGGIVIDAGEAPQTVSLSLTIGSMEVRRARPLLARGDDPDSDGVPLGEHPCTGGSIFECTDNCALIYNPEQEDRTGEGFGDVCELIDAFSGAAFLDSDGDGVADPFDNCIWVANARQENTAGVSAEGFPDLIGNACEEQIAQVDDDLVMTFSLDALELVELIQDRSITFLTVDFGNAIVRRDWGAGRWLLDKSKVEFCVTANLGLAAQGC